MPKPPPVEEEPPQPRSEAEELQMNINRVTDEVSCANSQLENSANIYCINFEI